MERCNMSWVDTLKESLPEYAKDIKLNLAYQHKLFLKQNFENLKLKFDIFIGLENDVLIYYSCNELINSIDTNYMYIPFDTYSRNIASIVYIPDVKTFKTILNK